MEVIYINSFQYDENHFDDTLAFYVLYLFAVKSYYGGYLSMIANNLKGKDKWSDEFVVNALLNNHPNIDAQEVERIKAWHAFAKKVKPKKHKNTLEIKNMNVFRANVENWKKVLVQDLTKILKNSAIDKWIDLFSPESVLLGGHIPAEMDAGIKMNHFGFLLSASIQIKDFLFFKPFLINQFKVKSIDSVDLLKAAKSENPDIFSFTLFTFPWCPNLTKEQMMATRDGLQKKMEEIWKNLELLQWYMNEETFDEHIGNKLNIFFDSIKTEISAFQERINNELYFQHTTHSQDKILKVAFRVAVTSIEHLSSFYEKNGVMVPFLAEALKNDLAMMLDIKKSYVVLYYDILDFQFLNES